MLKTYADIIDTPYFSRDQFQRVEKMFAADSIDPRSIRYQFAQRPDLEGIPYMLYASVDVEEDNG